MRPTACIALLCVAVGAAEAPFAGNEKVFEMAKTFKGRGVFQPRFAASWASPIPP